MVTNNPQGLQRLVVGNWKMNGDLVATQALLNQLKSNLNTCTTEVVVCPSFPYLSQVSSLLENSPIALGAQDLSVHDQGAYTGDVSALMLKEFGSQWVIVGHSERRQLYSESNQSVALKTQQALQHGLVPIVCVGETLQEHEANNTLQVIAEQLDAIWALGQAQVSRLVIAYEPVWAIGTGLTASPEQAQKVHAFIRQELKQLSSENTRILYGGSVNGSNAASLFAMPDINGALVGGASLKADEFLAIINA